MNKMKKFEAACQVIHAIGPTLKIQKIEIGRPFEVLDALLNGTKDKPSIYNVAFETAPHAARFLAAAEGKGFKAYGHRSIKRVRMDYVRTKTFRTVVIEINQ